MATLVKDPITGTFYSSGDPAGTGRTMVDLNGGVPSPVQSANPAAAAAATAMPQNAPPGADPYTIFNRNIASILTQIQNASTAGNAKLGGAKDALTTAAVTSAPYDASMTPSANIGIISGMPGAFAPAVTSIATQQANTASALQGLKDNLGTMATIFQPREVPAGTSLVTPAGDKISSGHQYTPQLNPKTGLTDGFDVNTGTWQSDDQGSVVGGVDFSGQATSTGAYATDPNYSKEVGGIYNTLSSAYPKPSADTIDTYIKGHAKSSPVTGQMIMNAATQYGVDPNLLTSLLAHESDFGTAGAATTTYNPGNVGNTDDGSRRAFKSWQQGVNAAANELARRKVPTSGTQSTTPEAQATSPVGGTFSPEATAKIAQLPKAYQNYVDAGPLGVAYINNDRVPDVQRAGLQTMASRAGIPYIQAADVNALKSIETVLNNLDSMKVLAQNNLGSGLIGRAKGLVQNPAAEFLQTDHGQQLGLFDNYRDVAIKAVQALAGGAGSGLRINGAEIAANTQNLPTSRDNVENSMAQIGQLKQLIYTQLATTFPYAPVPVVSPQGQEGTIPAGNLNTAIQKGYSVK